MNLGEMDKFLEKHKLLLLTYEEIDNLTRPINSKMIELVIKKSYPEVKVLAQMTSPLNSTMHLKTS